MIYSANDHVKKYIFVVTQSYISQAKCLEGNLYIQILLA